MSTENVNPETGEIKDEARLWWINVAKQLQDPFPIEDLQFRITSTNKDKTYGLLVAYVDSRAVQERFNDVLGIENWQIRLVRTSQDNGTLCEISVYDPFRNIWISKSDGAGDSEYAPFKGGISNSVKRAAARWGIGHYLYYLPPWWVSIDQKGKSHEPIPGEIERIINKEFPDWALPGGTGRPEKSARNGSAETGKGKDQSGQEKWEKILKKAASSPYNRSENEIRLLLGTFWPRADVEWLSMQDWAGKKLSELLNAPTRVNLVDEFQKHTSAVLDGDSFNKMVIEMEEMGIVPFGAKSNLIENAMKAIKIWGKYQPKKSGSRRAA